MSLEKNDDKFTVLKQRIIEFREQRNWKQFHTIKDLLIGLNIEVAELQELFLWKNEEGIKEIKQEKIEEELADIFIFLTYLSEHFQIDLLKAISEKLTKNENKYPVDKSWGSNKKYNELN